MSERVSDDGRSPAAPAAPDGAPSTAHSGLESGPAQPLRESVLVTGFPAFTARRLIAKLAASEPDTRIAILCPARARDDAASLRAELAAGDRVSVIVGDVSAMDLGLAGDEYRALTAEITTIHHLAGLYHEGVDKATARRVNVEGTRGVIELASECKQLRRLCHWSTAQVAGKRQGVILEEELDEGQSFHNIYEESKHQAEILARAAQRRLPVTILRPGIIVGDSRTGEIDKLDGPYYLMVLIATNATPVHLPLPGRGSAPLHVVPIDFVIDAAYALSRDERAAGRTFHLTDPNPLSARRIYELVAERSHTAAPRGTFPGRVARTILRTPGLERLARGPLAALDSFDHQVFYNSRGAQALLADAGVRCPPFDDYVDNVVRYVRQVHAAKRRAATEDVFDPFD